MRQRMFSTDPNLRLSYSFGCRPSDYLGVWGEPHLVDGQFSSILDPSPQRMSKKGRLQGGTQAIRRVASINLVSQCQASHYATLTFVFSECGDEIVKQ